MKKRGLGVAPPFLPPSVSVSFAELPAVLVLGHSTQTFTTPESAAATTRRAQGRICHFQWKTCDITNYDDCDLGSGFTASFFIVRHPLLKK